MTTTTHPVVWILTAFDRAGNIIGTITKHPNLPVVRTGAPGAFALFALSDMDAALPAALPPGDHDFTIGGEIRVQELERQLGALESRWDGRPF
jgi:hypothetical protein